MTRNASTLTHYSETLETATNNGAHWTVADLEMVDATRDIPVHEVAEALGRTLYAIWVARSMTRDEIREARERVTPKRPTLAYDRGYSDIEALFA